MKTQESQLMAAFRHYFDAFARQRDAETAARLASDRITGFGTGVGEQVYDIDKALDMYQRDVEHMPDPIEYIVKNSKAIALTEDVGIVMAEMDWHMVIRRQAVVLNDVRVTLVLRHTPEGWLVEHKHLSQPSPIHDEDEAYPLREMEDRASVLERMVEERTEELQTAHRRIWQLAVTDPLTGLYNRVKTDEVLDSELARQSRQRSALTIVLMDIDHFKPVNDDFGHHEGDRVLTAIARILSERCRQTDCLGRWGGEEFLLICPATSATEAAEIAQSLRSAVREKDFGLDRTLTMSCGITEYQTDDHRESIMERADGALYEAKQSGRDQVVVA